MKPLYLTIKKKWFDKILSGEKAIEFREVKPYYDSKFKNQYTKILLQAGYSKTAPQLTADILFVEKKVILFPEKLFEMECYCIHLHNPKLFNKLGDVKNKL